MRTPREGRADASRLHEGFANVLGNAIDIARNRAEALTLIHDLTFALHREGVETLEPAIARAKALTEVLATTLDRANAFERHIYQTQSEEVVNVSASNLSHLVIDDVELLEGVVWSDETIWPAGIASQVRAASHQIGPGVYQVGGGNERAPFELPAR